MNDNIESVNGNELDKATVIESRVGDDNPYKDYLPENRYKNEGNGVSPKLLKTGLFLFYILVAVVAVELYFKFSGKDLLKVESRNYNMNLAESINLSTIYSGDGVVWETNSSNVSIENGNVVALSTGAAYVFGRVDNKLVSDLLINVLDGNKGISIDNHSIQITDGEKQQVTVTRNSNVSSGSTFTVDDLVNNQSSLYYSEEETSDLCSNDQEDGDGDGYGIDLDCGTSYYAKDVDAVTNLVDNYTGSNDNDYVSQVTTGSSSNSNLTYKSSNTKVAKVDSDGNITPYENGTVVITVEDENGNTDYAYVTVMREPLIIITKNIAMKVGARKQVTYSIDTENYDAADIEWSSSDEKVVVAAKFGFLTAVGGGNAVVTARLGGVEKKVKVTVEAEIYEPTDLVVSPTSINLNVGDTSTVSAVVVPDNATDKTVSWSSTNESVAKVSDTGVITGVSSGKCQVYAVTSNGIKKAISVTVDKKVVAPTGIKLSINKTTVNVGEFAQLSYEFTPESTTNKSVEYNYNKKLVTIDSNGKVEAIGGGVATITITSIANRDVTDSVVLTIKSASTEISSIEIEEGDELPLRVGKKATLHAILNPSDLDGKVVTWKSSNEKIVTVDKNGNVTGVAVGEAYITANCDKESDKIKITVTPDKIDVESVEIEGAKNSLYVGKSLKLKAVIKPDNATNKQVKWSSSNTDVAKIDQNGNLKAKKEGTTRITVTSLDNSEVTAYFDLDVSAAATAVYVYEDGSSSNINSVDLAKGGKVKLVAKVKPDGVSQKVSWKVQDSKIATINQNGEVTAKSVGTTKIIVTTDAKGSDGKTISEYLSLSVTKKYKVLINPSHQSGNKTKSSSSKYSTEKKNMYEFSKLVEKAFESKGYEVYVSKENDGTVKFNPKVQTKKLIADSGASKEKVIYLALHSNAGGSKIGPKVYYYNYSDNKVFSMAKRVVSLDVMKKRGAESKKMTEDICTELKKTYLTWDDYKNYYNKYVKDHKGKTPGCISHNWHVSEPKYFYALGGIGGAALIEIGYHDKANNQKYIEDNGEELANSIVKGVETYLFG